MTLRYATLDRDGRLTPDEEIDDRVCDCCPTDALRTADGSILVAYRDRTTAEIRDVYVTRREGRLWSEPTPVHEDGWKISGCPVNGPALAAKDDRVACAWFTVAAPQQGRVRLAFSEDGGRRFADPVTIDDGNPLGRVDVVVLNDGSALVTWLEKTADAAEVRVRRVSASGERGASRLATHTPGSRSSGFPRMAHFEERVFLAWTEPGDPSHIRTGILR